MLLALPEEVFISSVLIWLDVTTLQRVRETTRTLMARLAPESSSHSRALWVALRPPNFDQLWRAPLALVKSLTLLYAIPTNGSAITRQGEDWFPYPLRLLCEHGR